MIRLLFEAAHIFPLFKMKGIAHAVPPDINVHVFGGILRGAETEAVEAERKLIAFAFERIVLPAGIHFTEHELPVIPLFLRIIIHRDAAAKIFHLHGAVPKTGEDDPIPISFPRFVYGIGKNLKYGMLAALDTIRPEDNRRAFPDAVRPLEGRDALVSVACLFRCHETPPIQTAARFIA